MIWASLVGVRFLHRKAVKSARWVASPSEDQSMISHAIVISTSSWKLRCPGAIGVEGLRSWGFLVCSSYSSSISKYKRINNSTCCKAIFSLMLYVVDRYAAKIRGVPRPPAFLMECCQVAKDSMDFVLADWQVELAALATTLLLEYGQEVTPVASNTALWWCCSGQPRACCHTKLTKAAAWLAVGPAGLPSLVFYPTSLVVLSPRRARGIAFCARVDSLLLNSTR